MVNAAHADFSYTPPLFGIFPTAEIGDGCHREVTLTLPLVVFILPKALLDWKMAVESGGRTNGPGCWGITGVFKSEFGKEMSDTNVPLMELLSGVGDLPERHRVSSPCPLCLLSWWFNTLCLSPQHIKPGAAITHWNAVLLLLESSEGRNVAAKAFVVRARSSQPMAHRGGSCWAAWCVWTAASPDKTWQVKLLRGLWSTSVCLMSQVTRWNPCHHTVMCVL